MAGKSQNKKLSTTTKQADLRPVDIYFERYTQSHQNPTNKLIQGISIPLMLFSLFGLLWAIPFPHLQFLGAYNGYFNWASFLIAFAVYFYSRLSPMLSYIMLIMLLGFSFGVIALHNWQNAGGLPLWLVSLVFFVLSAIARFIGKKIEGGKISFRDTVLFVLIGPIWLLHFVLKRFSVRY